MMRHRLRQDLAHCAPQRWVDQLELVVRAPKRLKPVVAVEIGIRCMARRRTHRDKHKRRESVFEHKIPAVLLVARAQVVAHVGTSKVEEVGVNGTAMDEKRRDDDAGEVPRAAAPPRGGPTHDPQAGHGDLAQHQDNTTAQHTHGMTREHRHDQRVSFGAVAWGRRWGRGT